MTPAVSILMAVRDGRYLAPALDTLLAQGFADFELVLVDDASDADTRALIDTYRRAEPRLVVLASERPMGLPAALNRGLAACRAPLVARADADDLYHPDRLGRQVAEMTARPSLAALSCGHHRIDAAGRRLWSHRPVTGPDRIRFRAMFANPLLHPGVMFRAAPVRALGGYDERFWTAQDSDLWARLSAVAELDNLADPLVEWRKHDASVLRRRGEAGKALSRTVSARLQTAYLGVEPAAADVAASVETWRAYTALEPATVRRGERALARILQCALSRESARVIADFRLTTARALLRHAHRAAGARAPGPAGEMTFRAARWLLGRPAAPAAEATPTGTRA